jgi:hypothetical protein
MTLHQQLRRNPLRVVNSGFAAPRHDVRDGSVAGLNGALGKAIQPMAVNGQKQTSLVMENEAPARGRGHELPPSSMLDE